MLRSNSVFIPLVGVAVVEGEPFELIGIALLRNRIRGHEVNTVDTPFL